MVASVEGGVGEEVGCAGNTTAYTLAGRAPHVKEESILTL